MALGRRRIRGSESIWPGFVDAMSALVMVLMFVLSVFMIIQFALRDTINTKEHELDALAEQLAGLSEALGAERAKAADLAGQVTALTADLAGARSDADAKASQIAALTAQLGARSAELSQAQGRIASFEAQVASLLAERDQARGEAASLTAERDRLASDRDALNLAIAKARSEIDAQTEAARLAAARREALMALVADLRARGAAGEARLSDAEAARAAEAAAAEALREKLKGATDELTAMTLALEEQRRRAEETLTRLAAAEAARKDLDTRLAAAILAGQTSAEELAAAKAALDAGRTSSAETERQLAAALAARLAAEAQAKAALSAEDERNALLVAADKALSDERAVSAENARKVALLNEQLAALRGQLQSLQGLLDASAAKDADAKVQIEALGSQLNSALAQVASEQRRRAELEAAERRRLEEEAKALKAETAQLARYRSEFFGRLSEVLAGREGVRVVGDRFVFSSEVLFQPASADLSPEGMAQIAGVVQSLQDVAAAIPADIDWIIRVDGHTDDTPLSGTGRYRDNWELSQARALAVVRYMIDDLGFPPDRLAAAGFGEFQPVAQGDSPEARAQNRRIELKLTER